MAAINSFDGFLNRIGGNFWTRHVIWDEVNTAVVAFGGNQASMARCGQCLSIPSMPGGVTAYIATCVQLLEGCSNPNNLYLVFKLVDFGSINIGTNVYTSGGTMPTITELGASNTMAGPILMQVTTALNSTPGNIAVTYTNQAGTGGNSTAGISQSLPTSGTIHSSGFVQMINNDWGAQTITAASNSGGTTPSGIVHFYGCIPIALMTPAPVQQFSRKENLVTAGFNAIRMAANDAIGVYGMYSQQPRAVIGEIYFVGDS
jgi:hypothetical protein